MKKEVPTWVVGVVFGLVLVVLSALFGGIPWGWRLSYGESYGQTMSGPVWAKEQKLSADDHVRVGQNVTFMWKGEGVVKRIKKMSSDGGWLWVSGDNTADGASLSSYEVGWLKLPCAHEPAPTSDPLVLNIAPKVPVEAIGVISDFWAPFDRRSYFEKATRFFSRPEDVIVAGEWLVLKGEKASSVFNRQSGKLVWEVPGRVNTLDAKTANFLKLTDYAGDPQEGQFNLETGAVWLSAVPKVATPRPGQVDLRGASISTSSRSKNPVNVFDGNPKTMWGVGQGTAMTDSIFVKFPTSVEVHSIQIDYTLMYGTTLILTVQSRKGERTIQPGQAIDEQIDGFTIMLRQHPVHQPVTGAVREVVVNG